jgi:two-component system, NtrC family, nitrogen regulation sensor histidine kinase NtrY
MEYRQKEKNAGLKSFLKKIIQKNGYLLLVAIFLFAAAHLLEYFIASTTSAKFIRNDIQSFLQEREIDFVSLSADTALLNRLISQEYSTTDLTRVVEKKYCVLLYEKDSICKLKFWNNQRILADDSLLQKTDGDYFVYLKNGQYDFVKKTIVQGSSTILAIALIPVHWQYYITITNLQPEFVNFPSAEDKFAITLNKTDLPVKSFFGNNLFYLLQKQKTAIKGNSWISVLLILASIMLVLIIVQNIAQTIAGRFGSVYGINFLLILLVLIRLIVYLFPFLLYLRQYELFDPRIYGSNFILSSLGDLLINSLLLLWVILFIRRRSQTFIFRSYHAKWKNWSIKLVILSIIVLITFIFAYIVQSLVADAKISFNVTNAWSLTKYSVIGFIVLASLALSFFFSTQILIRSISPIDSSDTIIEYIVLAFVGLLMLTFIRKTEIVELDIFVLVWLLIYIWLMQRKIFSGLNARLNISEVLFWLFIFSVSISAVIITENRRKELDESKLTAERLSEQANPSSEKVLSIALTYFDNDFLYPNFYRFKDSLSNAYLKDSLINNNFSTYRDKYDTKVYTFTPDERPLYNDETVSYGTLNTIFVIQGKPTGVQDLRYFEKSFDKFTYLYKKTITDTGQQVIGYFFILSEPKNYKGGDLLVPELFQQKKEFLPEYSQVYSYAIYNKNELIANYNNYAFPTRLTESQIPNSEFSEIKNGSYDELWYRIADDKLVVIAKKDNFAIEAITLFAYLFSAFLFLLALFRLASILINTRLQWSKLKLYLQFNIRLQIHTTIIFISLFSFIVIGVATIFFFKSRYDRNNQEQLSRAKEIVTREIQTTLASQVNYNGSTENFDIGSKEYLGKLIDEIAEIHGNDINLYDLNGTLTVSSNPFVYNKGILSEKMDPLAYYSLHQQNSIEFFNKEQMGRISYLSIYCPVRNEHGDAYAYLNIPSFRTQDELREEISKFLVTIINLNVFIFLIAGTIALVLTNRITASLTLISEKMRQINLGKTNEEIQWKRDDEIGDLVKEYNKMVKKLEESATSLAKSEREDAWREMARQVAHEIKNPLTPMKLSIQYLQKAVDNNSVNVKEMTSNVAKTLVEQIDHLSKIASDFSQFANIGNPQNELFDLHEMLYSLTSLYETTENILFKWVPIHKRILVFADKTQLNRLFTNLLQNALEACENRDKRVVSISESWDGQNIIVKVSDNGEGISVQAQSKIFIPNFTTKSSGTGLGLAMSKTIVEQAKGKIWFETMVGAGTTFFVELPVAAQEPNPVI